MTPLVERPDPEALARTLTQATSAEITGEDGRRTPVRGRALAKLREVLRIESEGGPRAVGWAPRAKVIVELARHQRPIATAEVLGDLSVRLLSWGEAAAAESPEALAGWLAEHGAEGPLRALARREALAPALGAFCEAAPAELRLYAEMIAGDPALARDGARLAAAAQVVRAARGGLGEAAWAFAAWYGARPGSWREGFTFEAVCASALRGLGVHAIIEAAAAGVPEEARAGRARFLCEEVTSRGWALDRRLPEPVRVSLVAAASAHGEDEEARARRLFLGEEERDLPGATRVAASSTSMFRRLTTDGARAFAVDGQDLVKLEIGSGRSVLTKLLRPLSPIAARDGVVLVLQPSGVQRVRVADGEARSGRGPLFDLPRRRLPGLLDAHARARDAALALVIAADAEVLPLEADDDACAAYEAFGGDRPAALDLRSFWGAAGRTLHEVPRRGAARAIALDGEPVWIGATRGGVLVVLAGEPQRTAVIAVDEGAAPRALGEVRVAADRVRSALLVGDRAWLCLAAPLGDVVVAVDRAG